jgi:hypothetical protein
MGRTINSDISSVCSCGTAEIRERIIDTLKEDRKVYFLLDIESSICSKVWGNVLPRLIFFFLGHVEQRGSLVRYGSVTSAVSGNQCWLKLHKHEHYVFCYMLH